MGAAKLSPRLALATLSLALLLNVSTLSSATKHVVKGGQELSNDQEMIKQQYELSHELMKVVRLMCADQIYPAKPEDVLKRLIKLKAIFQASKVPNDLTEYVESLIEDIEMSEQLGGIVNESKSKTRSLSGALRQVFEYYDSKGANMDLEGPSSSYCAEKVRHNFLKNFNKQHRLDIEQLAYLLRSKVGENYFENVGGNFDEGNFVLASEKFLSKKFLDHKRQYPNSEPKNFYEKHVLEPCRLWMDTVHKEINVYDLIGEGANKEEKRWIFQDKMCKFIIRKEESRKSRSLGGIISSCGGEEG